MQNYRKLFFLLTPRERRNSGFLLIMIIIMAFLDMIGVASIMPFITVLTNQSLVETNFFLQSLYDVSTIFGVENVQQFILLLGASVFILLIISLSFKALTIYFQVRFVQMREYSIGKRLIEGYLHQPYSWFLSRHSADLGKTILSEVQQSIVNGLNPFIELIAKGMITLTLISLLIVADPKLALITGFLLGGSYGFIFYFMRKKINLIGEERLKNNQKRFTVLTEVFGAVKEVKIGGLERTYINLFANASEKYSNTQATSKVISQLPRFFLEGIAFGGVIIMILYTISEKGNFNSALPILSLYVFAGYRLMPALQSIYGSLTQLAFAGPAISKLYQDLVSIRPQNIPNQIRDDIKFNKFISLKNINFLYPNSSRKILKNINLDIPVKSKIGLIGITGSGKTTLVDIILGLLKPNQGSVNIDGITIAQKNIRSWQSMIGYVPQNIYLIDDSVEANIALGIDAKDINHELIEKAAKIANLHSFITSELPDKYKTVIGERGIRLSGGQRQRIGIARALYHNPKLLILDEATSSLDNETEKAVIEAVNNLNRDITIILIAHRLNTVKYCDTIYRIENGQVIEKGNFDDIIVKNIESKNVIN